MAQRFHIRNKELRLPNESLRCPYTSPKDQSSSPDIKASVASKNFLMFDQTKLCFLKHGSNENSSEGSKKQIMGSNISEDLTAPNKFSIMCQNIPSDHPPKMKLRSPKRNLETMSASSNSSSPASEKNLVFSPVGHGQEKKFALSMSYDPQLFAPLSPLHQPTCHFCGLCGSLRCTQCKQIYYCSLECQKKDWQEHSVVCKPIKQTSKILRIFLYLRARRTTDKVEEKTKPLNEIKKKEKLATTSKKIEEQGKRTMFSALNSLGLKKDMKIEGTVTVFSNPGEFYVLVDSPEVLSNISKLSVKLKNYVGFNQEEYTPAKGEVCVAKHSVDQTWYRVLITDIDSLKKTAQVLYIDNGNGGNVPFHTIKPLHKDIAHFPPCAIKCYAANIHPVKEEWDANCCNTIAPLLVGKYCSLTIIDIGMGEITCFAVDVILSDSGKHLNEILLETGHVWDSKDRKILKDKSATGSAMGKISVQDKTAEDKGLAHNGCSASKIISLSIGDVFCGMVAHIQSPGNFFCQLMENGSKLSELQISLREYCDGIPTNPSFRPAVADMCCAQFTEDNQWYRASLLSYTSDQTALVGYVDYGNLEILQLNRLRPIIPKLMELPVQAIGCVLAGVRPASETWSIEATSLMKQLVQNKVLSIRVKDKKENTFMVELTDESVTPVISASKYLLNSGYAVKDVSAISTVIETTIGALHEASDQKIEKMDWTWVTVTPKQEVNVVMCVLCNPSEFYCHLLNNEDLNALKELNLSLVEYCQKTAPSISKITEGEPCCAYFSGDGKWYRALVKEATSSGSFKVQFVDYGNSEEVTLDKLRQISSTFLKLPFQAVRCRLTGITPINKEWTAEASAAFQMKTAGKKLQAKVVSLTKNCAEVELIDNSTGSPVMISEILINEHMALKKMLPKQNTLPAKLATSDFQEPSSYAQWTADFSVNETLSVRVLEVLNPSLFYAVPIKPKVDPQKLHRLMMELEDYCSSQKDHIFKPKVGEACCARFSGDDHWYRAVILGITASKVKVAYADYGNVEMLSLSRLQPIPAFLLELPFQILKCSLAGIMELDGQWHDSATEKLKNLILNESVEITIKSISESVYSVTVNKNCENSTLNIADQLVVKNLAKYSNSGHECTKKDKCCCTELRKRVTKLEQILSVFIKEHFGEGKLNENFPIDL